MLAAELLQILACPACHGTMQEVANGLLCPACRLQFPIEYGVPVLLTAEAVNVER